jgi:hypothetical protein
MFFAPTAPAPISKSPPPLPAIDQAPPASHRPTINQWSAAPLLAFAGCMIGIVWFCFVVGLFCLVDEGENSINQSHQSIPHGIHSS